MAVNNKYDHGDHGSRQFIWDKKTAVWYAAEYGDHISNNLAITNIILRANDILLDIGCGNGKAARLAAKICTSGKVIGIDPTATMIRIARKTTYKNYTNLEFRTGCAEKIPYPNESFSIATAINSLHHWQNYEKGLLEINRVLCPDGSLFIANDIVDGDTCGHGDGPLEKPKHITSILDHTGFINISIKKYYNEETGIYLISSKKP
jgi:ubiquinone/menaquinone biosynthesis C-methylase UbiE